MVQDNGGYFLDFDVYEDRAYIIAKSSVSGGNMVGHIHSLSDCSRIEEISINDIGYDSGFRITINEDSKSVKMGILMVNTVSGVLNT